MTYITGKSYAALSVVFMGLVSVFVLMSIVLGLLMSVPQVKASDLAILIGVPISAILGLLIPFWVLMRSSSPKLSFYQGLALIAESLMSGCFPLTLIYLFPIMILVYGITFIQACLSLVKGKVYSQGKWISLVSWFYKIRHGVGLPA